MNEVEAQLRELIIKKFGSLKKFTETIDMPWTTLDSILKRGVANSNISNVLKITKELGLDSEKLVDGKILFKPNYGTLISINNSDDEEFNNIQISKKQSPTYDDVELLIARNGKNITKEQKLKLIQLLSEDDN